MRSDKLNTIQAINWLASRSTGDFIVGLYVNRVHGGGQDKYLDALAPYLNKNGFVTIGMTTPASGTRCTFNNTTVNFEINEGEVKKLGRINVIIISDVDYPTEYPLESMVIATAHRLYYNLSDHAQSVFTMRHLDGWIVHGYLSEDLSRQIKDLWSSFFAPSGSLRTSKQFQIIPCGYPSLAGEFQRNNEIGIFPAFV